MPEHIKILFVDDERNVLKAIERLFIDDDYEILTANSGEEGLSAIESEYPVQLVISDYKMPGMNGVEFLRQVHQRWPDTVRIVFSGYADTVAVVEAINEGQIYKFIPKPWNDDELKITIANSIEWYSLNKKNLELAEELKKKNRELMDLNENLEKLVRKRTEELNFQNSVLIKSQNILESLPVGVMGIDTDNLIVQCNHQCLEMLSKEGKPFIGFERIDVLPDMLNSFIDRIFEQKYLADRILIDKEEYKVRGCFVNYNEEQRGVILVIDRFNIYE